MNSFFIDPAFSDVFSLGAKHILEHCANVLNAEIVDSRSMKKFLKNANHEKILFMCHRGKYPKTFANDFMGFLAKGGVLVWIEAQPFGLDLCWTPYGWGKGDPCDYEALGISPWYLEPMADLNQEEQYVEIESKYSTFFGSCSGFHATRALCSTRARGTGRQVTLGTMVRGATTYGCNNVFTMVEPGQVWNKGGGRIVTIGTVIGRGIDINHEARSNEQGVNELSSMPDISISLEKAVDLFKGIINFLQQDQRSLLKAGLSVKNPAVPMDGTIEVFFEPRTTLNASKWTLTDENGKTLDSGFTQNKILISASGLNPGKYLLELYQGNESLGLRENISVLDVSTPIKSIRAGVANGYPAFIINNKVYPVNNYCGYATPRTIESIIPGFCKAGIHIYNIGITLEWGWIGENEFDWSGYDLIMERIFREDPEALLFPRIRLGPPAWWREKYGKEALWHHEGGLFDEPQDKQNVLYMSYFSSRFISDIKQAIKSYVSHSLNSWYRNRFIGVFYTYGSTGEWGEQPRDGYLWSDHHPEAVADFRKYLSEKYSTNDNLAAAWCQINNFTIDDIVINNSPHFRKHNCFHHLLDSKTRNYGKAHEICPNSLEKAEIPNALKRRISKTGIFRDPEISRDVIDYLESYSVHFSEFQNELSTAIKEASQGRCITGTFGGYTISGPYEIDGGAIHTNYPEHLDETKNLDLLCAASMYYRGENPTGDMCLTSLCDSYKIHNKFFLQELDQHTCLSKTGSSRYGTPDAGLKETIGAMKRNWMIRISRGVGFWWFDFSRGYYDHPELLETIRKLNAIQLQLTQKENKGKFKQKDINPCAFIYSAKSHNYTVSSSNFLRRVGINFFQRHLNRIGLPSEIYFPEDLPLAPERKVYVFMNVFFLTKQQREWINENLKKNGNMIIWLYGQGVIDEKSCNIENSSELTGFHLEMQRKSQPVRIVPDYTSSHPVIKTISNKVLDDFGTVITDDAATAPTMDSISPQIWITDSDKSIEKLGFFEGSEKTGFAIKEFVNWTSVYASAAIIPSTIYKALLKYKNIQLLYDGPDCFYTNGDIIGLNSCSSSYKTFKFPDEYIIEDLFSGEKYMSMNGKVTIWVSYADTFIGRISKVNEKNEK